MRHQRLIAGLVSLGVLAAGGASVVAVNQPAKATAQARSSHLSGVPRSCPHKSRTERYDPRDALPLPGNGIAPAVNAAIYAAEHGIDRASGQLHRDAFAYQTAVAHQPGFTYRHKSSVELYCGTRIAQRTVVVNLFFPHALPSASLSYGQVWVSRFPGDRYRVWFVFH